MGRIREWGLDSVYGIGFYPPERERAICLEPEYILNLRAENDETDVLRWLQTATWTPTYVIAPDKGKSRENSIVAANIRRFQGFPIIVTIRGKTRRERLDFTAWMIEEDYIPAFPRFLHTGDAEIPMPRHQLINEQRELIEKMGPWIYALPRWRNEESTALELIKAIPGQWEAILE